MGGTNGSTAGRRYRRARRLRHERHGVVAVIGTLLALLVFFALFGIFITQYLPLWMTDNEALFTSQAQTSFLQLKGAIDSQYFIGGPSSYGIPFTISSQGVPLLAQPTEGGLSFVPNTCPTGFYGGVGSTHPGNGASGTSSHQYGQPVAPGFCVFANITESPGPGGSPTFSQVMGTGTLQMLLPNRYYTPETFYYEDDAVIQAQSTGYQIMLVPPPLNISVVPGNTTISDTLLQLYGNASSAVGQGSAEVYSELRYSQFLTDNGTTAKPVTFTFEIGTLYPCAWSPYLYKVLTSSGLPLTSFRTSNEFSGAFTTPVNATYPGSPSSCFGANGGGTQILSFSLTSVNYAELFLAGVQISLGVGSVS